MNTDKTSRVTRRTMLRLFVSAAGLGVLAACGTPALQQPAPPAPPAPTPAPKPAGAAAARPGGTLRIGQVGDIVNLEPHFNQNTTSENTWLAYDRLTAYDANWTPQPMLAESWDVSADAKRLKLNLRKGVQFHSGRELISDDVKYTFERIRDPKVGVGQFALQGQWFQTVETPDKYTVILTADQPRPLVFDLLESLNIVDKQTLEVPTPRPNPTAPGHLHLPNGSRAITPRGPRTRTTGRAASRIWTRSRRCSSKTRRR